MAPVDIPEPLIEPPSVHVGQPDTQGKPLITQPAGGVLTRMDQGRADAAPLQRSHDLQVIQMRDAGKVEADFRHVGWLPHQVHITHGTVIQPGNEQHASPLVLASQAVSEERPLPECSHKRGKLGSSARPDLHLRTHGLSLTSSLRRSIRFRRRAQIASADRDTAQGDQEAPMSRRLDKAPTSWVLAEAGCRERR
jgi:hypothetical protein